MTDAPSDLTKASVDPNPLRQFEKWYQDLSANGMSEQDATSMTLATAAEDGSPCARIVLMKGFDDRGFVFYTNYNSRKGIELAENARACLLFYWSPVWRQVRIEGSVEKVSDEESAQYFHSRPLGSKIGAWASKQSWKFGDNVPRPPHWGGYRLKPATIEFWQGRENRLHDRLRYRLREDGTWVIERLGP